MRDMTPKQFAAVACPTCGVDAGQRCLLHSGGFRSEAHIDRKLSAFEALETNRALLLEGRRLRRNQGTDGKVPFF
jgi:hypothetical protein